MHKKLWLLSALGIVFVFALVAGYGYISARESPQFSLMQQLIQENDLPEGTAIQFKAQLVTNMPGPLSHVNLPFQSPGFMTAARTDVLYPITLTNDKSASVYVMNIIYQFETAEQAQMVLQRQPEFVTRYHKPGLNEVAVAKAEQLTNKYDGSFICKQYSLDNNDNLVPLGEGLDLETCYFFGVKDNLLIFLMLDGFYIRDATSQQILEDLAAKLLER